LARLHHGRAGTRILRLAVVLDVLLQPHKASLEFTFYQGQQFPAECKGIFSPPSTAPGTNHYAWAMK
jgi:hypothetical protein